MSEIVNKGTLISYHNTNDYLEFGRSISNGTTYNVSNPFGFSNAFLEVKTNTASNIWNITLLFGNEVVSTAVSSTVNLISFIDWFDLEVSSSGKNNLQFTFSNLKAGNNFTFSVLAWNTNPNNFPTTDIYFGPFNWNSIGNEQRWFPIASSSFYDDYNLDLKSYQKYILDTTLFTANYDEASKRHTLTALQSFTAQTRSTFNKFGDDLNGLLLNYRINEYVFDPITGEQISFNTLDTVNSGSANIAFDRVKTINFVAGNVYEFVYTGTPSVGGGFFIENFKFYIKKI